MLAPHRTKRRPSARPNPEKAFSKDRRYGDLNPRNFDSIIRAFERRVLHWYFFQAKEIKEKVQAQGFIITQIACTIIDVLSQYVYNLQESDGNYYKRFLKEHIAEFNGFIDPPIKSFTYLKRDRKWKVEEIRDFADAFWHAFRCGVVHNAMILDYGRISGEDIVGKGRIVCLRTWGNGEREVAVNPFELMDRLEEVFRNYIGQLLDPKNKQLRRNFSDKFYLSFGLRIVP